MRQVQPASTIRGTLTAEEVKSVQYEERKGQNPRTLTTLKAEEIRDVNEDLEAVDVKSSPGVPQTTMNSGLS